MKRGARVVPLIGALAALALLGGACNLLVSTPDASVQRGHSTCGLPAVSGGCGACLQSQCCAQEEACSANPSCAAYEACILPCVDDYACRARCLADHPVAASADVAALNQCVVARCETACGVSCGVTDTISAPDAAASCRRCVEADDGLCGYGQTCGEDVECMEIIRCFDRCRTRDCQLECPQEHDAGSWLASGLVLKGLLGECATACGSGQYWGCLGNVTWPLPKGNHITLHLSAVDQAANATALANTDVAACGAGASCDPPLASGTTDSQGKVTLELPIAPSATYGFSGHFVFTPHPGPPGDGGSVGDDAVMPSIYFLNGPLSEVNASYIVLLYRRRQYEQAAAQAGLTLDPTRGHAAVTTRDCHYLNTSGAVVTAEPPDPAMTQVYVLGQGVFTPTAHATDGNAQVIFVNAPPTTMTFTVKPASLGQVSSSSTLFVRPGMISVIESGPKPP